MKTYKRTARTLLAGIVSAPVGGAAAALAFSLFNDNTVAAVSTGSAVCAVILWLSIFSENISFTLSEQGELRFYRRGKLKNAFALPECVVGYEIVSGRNGNNITLRVTPAGSDETVSIDASPIGVPQFTRMFGELEKHCAVRIADLKAADPNV